MYTRSKWILLAMSTTIIIVLAAFTLPARGVVANGTPGGFLSLQSAPFIDSATGQEYSLTVIAGESEENAGVGNVTLQLLGPSLSACSVHGAGVDIGPELEDGNYAGNLPLTETQCGTAFGMAVSIDGCTAKTEMHGFSHSDYPLFTYLGSTTIELTLRKSGADGKVNLKVYTPKGPIKLDGKVSGPFTMNTCQ